jgi:hypothetical protein
LEFLLIELPVLSYIAVYTIESLLSYLSLGYVAVCAAESPPKPPLRVYVAVYATE